MMAPATLGVHRSQHHRGGRVGPRLGPGCRCVRNGNRGPELRAEAHALKSSLFRRR